MTNKNTDLTNINAGQNVLAGLGDFAEFKATSGEQVIGMEDFDASDAKLPKIKLIQPTSLEATKGQCPAGWFYNSITKEKFQTIPCILLAFKKSRVRWKKPFKRGEEPLCRSFDGKRGDKGVNCATCPYAKWDNLKDGATKPECNQSYVWLGIDQNKSPFRIIMSGSNVSITKDYLNTIAPTKLPPFIFTMDLCSEQKENDSGVFYVIKYKQTGTIAKADFADLKDLTQGMSDIFFNAVQHDTLVQDDDTETTEDGTPGNGKLF
jgi:hypothetical protein